MSLKVLSVDDSSMMRMIVKNFVSKEIENVVFLEASNGKEGFEKYKAEMPNIVFLDIMMPEMNGIDAARAIKEFDNNANIIMCTSVKQDAQEKEVIDIGVIGYVLKPFKQEEIREVLKTNGFIG